MESDLNATQFSCLRLQLEQAQWVLTATDGGQNNFVGWEAHYRFEKAGAVLTLIEGERAGQAYYTYEANPKALVQLNALLTPCQS